MNQFLRKQEMAQWSAVCYGDKTARKHRRLGAVDDFPATRVNFIKIWIQFRGYLFLLLQCPRRGCCPEEIKFIMPVKLRVLLADDHAVVREGLKLLVNAQPDMEVVAEASNGRVAIQKAQQFRPDVIVMDISMPMVSGSSAVRQIKQIMPQSKMLALSVHEDKSYLREMLEAGVSGYVLKRSAADDLIRAIRTVSSGGVYLDLSLAIRVVGDLVRRPQSGGTFRVDGLGGGELSEREGEVLRRIAQGYSNKEIAAQLTLSVKTVETYKARSMEKLSLDSRVDIVRYALLQGWLNEGGSNGGQTVSAGEAASAAV